MSLCCSHLWLACCCKLLARFLDFGGGGTFIEMRLGIAGGSHISPGSTSLPALEALKTIHFFQLSPSGNTSDKADIFRTLVERPSFDSRRQLWRPLLRTSPRRPSPTSRGSNDPHIRYHAAQATTLHAKKSHKLLICIPQ